MNRVLCRGSRQGFRLRQTETAEFLDESLAEFRYGVLVAKLAQAFVDAMRKLPIVLTIPATLLLVSSTEADEVQPLIEAA
ncbi:hypothetical protein N9D23_15525, partial [Rubripirellula sp.]|nr:hypothetical protein [Rubripirellula sp.]